jgi:signal transduction histidine kinase
MFKSIRWRLVISYMAVTLVTVLALGVLTYSLLQRNIHAREKAVLESNALAVARQAVPYLELSTPLDELDEMAHMMGYLANLRVRILEPSSGILVDTGSPQGVDRFYWISPRDISLLEEEMVDLADEFEIDALTIPFLDESGLLIPHEFPRPLRDTLGGDRQFQELTRLTGPWGFELTEGESIHSGDDEGSAETRSNQMIEVPIGGYENPLGYVQVLESQSYQKEALQILLKPFLIASAGSIVLSGIIGLVVGHRLSSPIIALTQGAERMGSGDLSIRVDSRGKDEIGQLGMQFNHMADQLERSFHDISVERDTLRRFIADASHELRTPITALRNFLELIQGKAKQDQKARANFLSDSIHQVERLEWITDNLLNISRLEAGLWPLSLERIDIEEFIKAIASPFDTLAEKKQVKLTLNPPKNLELMADRALLQLAFTNMIDNAIKFTPEGGHIQFGARATEDGARFWVRDTGIGIGQEELAHIFDRFYRGHGHEEEGSGLGLALVKSVVDAHAGQVQVESEPGAGSNFILEIPSQANDFKKN